MNKLKIFFKTALFTFAVFATNLQAHDPSLHGFSLITFDPPFPAPPLQLPTLDEKESTLEQFKGGYVLLNFWATWCPPCLEEMPSMETIHQRYKDKGFSVVAVSSDEGGREDVLPFIEKLGVTFPILLDADKAVSSVYGAINLPLSFVLDPEGNVILGAQGERDWSSEEAISVLDELIGEP